MDLWIRNQSKTRLIKANDVHLDYENKIMSDKYFMGEYETEKRALEVLDEIQKLLVGDLLVFTNTDFEEGLADYVKPYKTIAVQDKNNLAPRVEFVHRDCVVYEMPKE